MRNYLVISVICLLTGCASFGGRSEQCSGIRSTVNGYVVQDREDCVWGGENTNGIVLDLTAAPPSYGYSRSSYPAQGRSGYQSSPSCPTIYRNGKRQCM